MWHLTSNREKQQYEKEANKVSKLSVLLHPLAGTQGDTFWQLLLFTEPNRLSFPGTGHSPWVTVCERMYWQFTLWESTGTVDGELIFAGGKYRPSQDTKHALMQGQKEARPNSDP